MKSQIHRSVAIAIVLTLAWIPGATSLAAQDNNADQELLDPERPLSAEIATSIDDGFTFAAVGDCIIARPHSQMLETDPAFAAVIKIIREADVSLGNLETSLIDIRRFEGYPEAEDGGCWCIATPPTAKDLKDLGFDMFSRANNHALDWGRAGMRETSGWLDRAGLVHAGSGRSASSSLPRNTQGTRKPSVSSVYFRRVLRGSSPSWRRSRPAWSKCPQDDASHDGHRADDAVAGEPARYDQRAAASQ